MDMEASTLSREPATTNPEMKLVHSTPSTSPFVPGRREFFKYRDLGVSAATGGKVRAQVMSATNGLTRPTGWHYHKCEAQFIYVLKGWVDLEFENGEKHRVSEGDSMLIPGGMRHNETAAAEEIEILELSLPGEMGTVACDAPAVRSAAE